MYCQRTPPPARVRGAENDSALYCPPWLQLAMAYVPYQPLNPPTVAPDRAIRKGTLFPDLYRPYEPRWDCRDEYLMRRGADA
ncbi:MAG: spore coat associated protein CotJA [Bacillota bacterium]